LQAEIDAFLESRPCELLEKIDTKNQRYLVQIKLNDPPERLALIAGDVFNCLRASLDHLAWCLVLRNTGRYPGSNTQFPILEQPDPGRFDRQTFGIATEALAIIEYLQPYHATNTFGVKNHVLWRLNKLCNIDKHRRIPIHGESADVRSHPDLGNPTVDNDDTMSWPLSLRNAVVAKGEVALNPTVVFRIIFGDSIEGIECDIAGIKVIYNFVVNEVIPAFARFF
jgi:hypothetical protein